MRQVPTFRELTAGKTPLQHLPLEGPKLVPEAQGPAGICTSVPTQGEVLL